MPREWNTPSEKLSVTLALIIAAETFFASVLTAVFYWIDKRAARAGTQRIPEKTLLLASVLGGWPGGCLAGQKLRHKTAKVSYRIQFVVAAVIHVLAVVAILWAGLR
ncbi:DUF1294 domain-containing protein [Rhodopirellula islandica]|uniref:DUF1294 domain-containing protein n=1 Tax=Rhodopirellula islandica TaxID=595434 RepID=UPI00064A813D|nr:DUF1294 domain-containing protein [Rhodopirellula islandica]